MIYRSIFFSDLHLRTRAAQPDRLTNLLDDNPSDVTFCIGDYMDMWIPDDEAHVDGKAYEDLEACLEDRHAVRLRGNHDPLKRLPPFMVYTLADGRDALVIHGDAFDAELRAHKAMAHLGARVVNFLARFNRSMRLFGRLLNLGRHWSFSTWLMNLPDTSAAIAQFNTAAARAARKHGCQVVICGHTHEPGWDVRGEIEIWNCGDWMGNCTAVAETQDGKLHILKGLTHAIAITASL
jgi:UDP-2,3-diacylglucosamine pyrophosphatase LpxH